MVAIILRAIRYAGIERVLYLNTPFVAETMFVVLMR